MTKTTKKNKKTGVSPDEVDDAGEERATRPLHQTTDSSSKRQHRCLHTRPHSALGCVNGSKSMATAMAIPRCPLAYMPCGCVAERRWSGQLFAHPASALPWSRGAAAARAQTLQVIETATRGSCERCCLALRRAAALLLGAPMLYVPGFVRANHKARSCLVVAFPSLSL
jgi:hypothetical protein